LLARDCGTAGAVERGLGHCCDAIHDRRLHAGLRHQLHAAGRRTGAVLEG